MGVGGANGSEYWLTLKTRKKKFAQIDLHRRRRNIFGSAKRPRIIFPITSGGRGEGWGGGGCFWYPPPLQGLSCQGKSLGAAWNKEQDSIPAQMTSCRTHRDPCGALMVDSGPPQAAPFRVPPAGSPKLEREVRIPRPCYGLLMHRYRSALATSFRLHESTTAG